MFFHVVFAIWVGGALLGLMQAKEYTFANVFPVVGSLSLYIAFNAIHFTVMKPMFKRKIRAS